MSQSQQPPLKLQLRKKSCTHQNIRRTSSTNSNKNRTSSSTVGVNNNQSHHVSKSANYMLFSQLSELYLNSAKSQVWKEAARSLIFIEYVEESGKWSNPYVATISLHSLIELRRLIQIGLVQLDYEFKGQEFSDLIDDLAESLIKADLITEENRTNFKETLLLPRYHQYQKEFEKQIAFGPKHSLNFKCVSCKGTNEKSEKNGEIKAEDEAKENSAAEDNENSDSIFERDDEQSSIEMEFEERDDPEEINKNIANKEFLKRIALGTKVANVMVGEVDYLEEEVTLFVRLRKPIIFPNLSEVPVATKYLFILLGPKGHIKKYRQIGYSLITLFSDELFQTDLYEANERNEIMTAIDGFLDHSTIIPPGQWDITKRIPPPLKIPTREERLVYKLMKVKKDKPRSGGHHDDQLLEFSFRFGHGLINDIKRKAKWYWSDFGDAYNHHTLPAIAFLYFACLAPIVTFGGLLGYATDNNMATIESLIAGLICGLMYSLFAGQPMTILGNTGPMLVFETILNSISKKYELDYIGFRCLVGLWVCLILLVVVVMNLSVLVKYITRFTEELFAILIALIFVYESVEKLLIIRKKNPFSSNPFVYQHDFNENSTECFRCVNDYTKSIANSSIYSQSQCSRLGSQYSFLRKCQHVPDVFLFSLLLYICSFCIMIVLRMMRRSSFLPRPLRILLSNFSVVVTIAVMVTIDYNVGLNTQKLEVPSKFNPTIPDRGWFINPLERNKGKWWLVFVAIPPAILASILIFMDQNITVLIVNRKENKLKKSYGYHLDLLIIAVCVCINSLFGLPFYVGATVLSMNHVISLRRTVHSRVPGVPDKVVGVIEQRVTGTIVFILIGCSIFVTHYLKLIPMSVLYAVFLYMGIAPLFELEFFHRILLLFMPKGCQPDLAYLRHVRLSRVNLFTVIQLVCLCGLFLFKANKAMSITFPLMVLSLVFIRFGLNYVFTEKELAYLDELIPGTNLTQKRVVNVREIDDGALEKLRRNHTTSFSSILNKFGEKEKMITTPVERPAGLKQSESAANSVRFTT